MDGMPTPPAAGTGNAASGDYRCFVALRLARAEPFDLIVLLVEEATVARIEPHLGRLLAPDGRVIRAGDGPAVG